MLLLLSLFIHLSLFIYLFALDHKDLYCYYCLPLHNDKMNCGITPSRALLCTFIVWLRPVKHFITLLNN